jgi:hypothetical protein
MPLGSTFAMPLGYTFAIPLWLHVCYHINWHSCEEHFLVKMYISTTLNTQENAAYFFSEPSTPWRKFMNKILHHKICVPETGQWPCFRCQGEVFKNFQVNLDFQDQVGQWKQKHLLPFNYVWAGFSTFQGKEFPQPGWARGQGSIVVDAEWLFRIRSLRS